MSCRVCHSNRVRKLGTVEFYRGYPREIHDCDECTCRFTRCDPEIYDILHANEHSRYDGYHSIARECQQLFAERNLNGLRSHLCSVSKYRFVIREIENRPEVKKILEIGCSRGYLTSYFILRGCDIDGIDLSLEAVKGANNAFGHHFRLATADVIQERGPLDAIYHVGMIGCVEDPAEYTHRMLAALKPGGILLFNAPNVEACWMDGQLWLDSAPPPDVVTLYRKGFWTKNFAHIADVEEYVEFHSPEIAFALHMKRWRHPAWQPPKPEPLEGSTPLPTSKPSRHRSFRRRLVSKVSRSLPKLGALFANAKLIRSFPTDFGLFVKMTKK
jgi:SAM-dependent methyltransferase